MKQKIKLIASDLDGTLLQNHVQSCSKKAIRMIQEVTNRGILFVRQAEDNILIYTICLKKCRGI